MENKNEVINSTIKRDDSAENTLSAIAGYLLIAGLIGSLLLIVMGLEKIDSRTSDGEALGVSLVTSVVYILPSSIVGWALLKVLKNISITLKDIREKMK